MKWMVFGPETFTFLAAFFFLVMSMTARPNPRRDHLLALGFSVLGIYVCLGAMSAEGSLFMDVYRVNLFSQVFKLMLMAGLFLILCISRRLDDLDERYRHEFYLLLFVCTLSMMMLVSADHLLTIYMSLELSSYSLYILASLRRRENLGLETGLKYFIIGIFSSAIMVFGLAMLYGSTQAMSLTELVQVLPGMVDRPGVIIAVLLALGGFFFKLAVFPFHFWVPDVYQGAMNEVTAYIATASKVAAVGILLKFVAATGQGSAYIVHVLVALSVVTMTVGNLAAIVQKDLKRLMGYSSIAHAGYVLIGILSMNSDGFAGAVFYTLALLLMKFTIFLVIVMVAANGENLQISQLAGLHRRSPILALGLMVALFSLAGIPPTIGFTGKFLLFVGAIKQGFLILTLIAMVNVVISLYYYLLIIKAAYLLQPVDELPPIAVSTPLRALTAALIGAMVVAGFFPTYFIRIAEAAARSLL